MLFPALNDTIVAVSTAWEASPLGIVRLSGQDSFELAVCLGARPPAPGWCPCWTSARLVLGQRLELPATVFWFRGPRSYTGQDVVELHVPGCLPLLRELCAHLIELGARRALPGEFTARAYLNRKLSLAEVDNILALISAGQAESSRQRLRVSGQRKLGEQITGRLEELLAQIEAGIDFADEEDIRIVTAPQLRTALRQIADLLSAARQERPLSLRAARPHVALAGLSNAGKSTLFNALVGFERAIVSPVVGTTRDVLSAEVRIGDVAIVLQDTAGLHDRPDELELAAHLSAERAAEQADLVLWLHVAGSPWSERELETLSRIPAQRRVLVLSKADLTPQAPLPADTTGSAATVRVSATTGEGLGELRLIIRQMLARSTGRAIAVSFEDWERASAAVERALSLVPAPNEGIQFPELIALELREALSALSGTAPADAAEAVLRHIYSQFCVGK